MYDVLKHLVLMILVTAPAAAAQSDAEKTYVVSPQQLQAIEAASPAAPPVPPARPRRVLVYGRVPTHPESVATCFQALQILGRKSGAFEAVCSGDPAVFLPQNLQQFDAVVMNNTHERTPLLPRDLEARDAEARAAAIAQEPLLKKSLLEYLAAGKGLVGVHGATAGNVQWPEFVELFGAQYAGHLTTQVWVKPVEADHPLTASLDRNGFQVHDEIYYFRKALGREPYTANDARVLLELDLSKTPDPGKRPDKRYVVTWIRSYGQGRVFYCSLGHQASVYANPHVLAHYLAGIQWAVGDLPADATPRP